MGYEKLFTNASFKNSIDLRSMYVYIKRNALNIVALVLHV